MSATSDSLQKQAEIRNQQRLNQKNSHPFPLAISGRVRQLCDPQVNFPIERIKLTTCTGFMVVLVYGRVRPTPLKSAANQRCRPVPAASLFLVVFAQHSG